MCAAEVEARAIVVVGKPARRGEVKTRLAESIGLDRATELYRGFLADIATVVSDACEDMAGRVSPVLAWKSDPEHRSYAPFHGGRWTLTEQPAGDLGACMSGLTRRLLDGGADQVLIVGTDSPTLQPRHLSDAFGRLDEGADVVLGPSFDGGYYLIGLSGAHEAVFRDIEWSTGSVLGQTLRRAREADLLCELTEFWYDVDTLGDLKKMRAHLFEYLTFRHSDIAPATREILEALPEYALDE